MKLLYSIIIATRNEEEGIAKVLCSIPERVAKQSEIIVVDSSTDCTPTIAKRLGAKVIKENKKGKGRAMKRGVKESKSDILIFLDGDGADPSEYIPKLLKKLENSDLVLGCRSMKSFKTNDMLTRLSFLIYIIFFRPFFYLICPKVEDPLAGFRVIRRKDWHKLNLKSNDFEIETEMNAKAVKNGFTVKEVIIPNLKRAGGLKNSKFVTNPRMIFKVMKTIIKYILDR